MINKVKLKVSGISTYPLNMLAKRGIKVKDIKFSDDYIEFYIKTTDLEECQKHLLEYKREFEIKSITGFSATINKLKKRVGLIIGIIIFVIISTCYSLMILTVNISGNDLVATEIIQKKVAETIKPPLFNAKIDRARLEKAIVSINGISSASVSKIGTTINIQVLEELPLTDIEDIKAGYRPITSKYDSLITRLVVTSGTPLVKVGQAVQQGKELIAPYLIADEQTKVLCKAGGEVYGRIWLTIDRYYEDKKLTFKRTGRRFVVYDLKAFNWIANKKQPYNYYEIEQEIVYIGAAIPIKMVKYTYYETEKSYVDFDFDLYRDTLIKELSSELEIQIPEGGEFIRSWYEVKRLDKKTQLVIYYEVETLIV